MQIFTFRADSMQDALRQVRCTLGPDAAVLQTREVPRNLIQWLAGSRQVEIVASNEVNVPSRLPAELAREQLAAESASEPSAADDELESADEADGRGRPSYGEPRRAGRVPPIDGRDYRIRFREGLKSDGGLRSLVEELSRVHLATDAAAVSGTTLAAGPSTSSDREFPKAAADLPSSRNKLADVARPANWSVIEQDLLAAGFDRSIVEELFDTHLRQRVAGETRVRGLRSQLQHDDLPEQSARMPSPATAKPRRTKDKIVRTGKRKLD